MTSRARRAAATIVALLTLDAGTAAAQSGVLAGVILDHTNRTGLDGVIVRITGTSVIVATDREGRFTIPAAPVGSVELEARRPGYATFKLSPVRVASSDTARVSFSMSLEAPSAREIGWRTNAAEYRGMNEQSFTVRCPAGGPPASVWGTDVYTDDSSVCTAAVHAGRITLADGGVVTFEIRPGLDVYAASTRNGVASSQFNAWQGSFVIR